jgi:hypothetical protein
MDLGARMSPIFYLQSWSESIALVLSISWISPRPPKPRFLSSSKIRREIFAFGKKTFWELVPCVEVTLVSKFHLIWYPIAQESSLESKGRISFPIHLNLEDEIHFKGGGGRFLTL